jgi:beta-phosphoglucomutase-like phosphatase (HAD superfamily)
MPEAVIFDVDGTLVDSVDQHARSWQDAFRDFGLDLDFPAIRGHPRPDRQGRRPNHAGVPVQGRPG